MCGRRVILERDNKSLDAIFFLDMDRIGINNR